MIRPLDLDRDLPWVIDILEREAAGPLRYPEPLNREHITKFWRVVYEHRLGRCLIDPGAGFLLGMLGQDPLSGKLISIAQIWFVRPHIRGLGRGLRAMRLLDQFVLDSRLSGCVRVCAGQWFAGPSLDRIYARLGFTSAEQQFVKSLE